MRWFYQKMTLVGIFMNCCNLTPPPLSPQSGFDVSYIYHHFYLKASKCPKGTVDSSACRYRNDRVSFVWLRAVSIELSSGGTPCPNLSLAFCFCVFMQPLIDCAICYKTYGGEIEQEPKPYVHCIHKPALTEVSLLHCYSDWQSCDLFMISTLQKIKRKNTQQDYMFFLFFPHSSVWQEMKLERVNHCNRMGYSSGAATVLASSGAQWTLWQINIYLWTSAQ